MGFAGLGFWVYTQFSFGVFRVGPVRSMLVNPHYGTSEGTEKESSVAGAKGHQSLIKARVTAVILKAEGLAESTLSVITKASGKAKPCRATTAVRMKNGHGHSNSISKPNM